MELTSDKVFVRGLDFFSEAVGKLHGDRWELPSPCKGWSALDVLGHVGAAVGFGTALLRDEAPAWDPADPPGQAVEGPPGTWWAALAGPARQAVEAADLDKVVDSPMGRRSVGEGLALPAFDLFVHGWDLGHTAGADVEIPGDVIDYSRTMVGSMASEEMIRNPRVFGPEVPAPPDATPTEAFVAWTGRDPRRTT